MQRKMPIFYSALMLTGVNLLLRFTGTSFQIYISNRIGPAGVGLLQLVMSVGMLAMVAGMAGIRTTSMYLTAEQLGKKQSGAVTWVLSSCFGYSIICSGVISAILYVFAPYLAEYWVGDIRTLGAIRLYAAFLPVSGLCGVMTGYFTAANRISALAAVEVAEQTISMVSTFLILSLWSGTDPARACLGVILGSGIGGCITLVALCVLRLRERTSAGPKTPIIRRLLGCAIPLAVADVTKAGISTTENLMVPKRLSRYPVVENPLAAFGMVCGMVFPLIMFPAAILFSLAELLLPELARCKAAGSTERIRYLVQRSLRSTMIYGFFFCAIMFRLADFLSLQLYDNSEVGIHLQRYSLLIPILYCDAITDAMTKGLGQQKACVRYNIVTSALDVVLLFWLLPRYGMDGYFFSFLMTHGLNFFLSLRRLLRISQIEIHFSKPVAAAAATALSIWFSSLVHQPIVSAVGCLIIQLCLFFLLKVINREDIGWIQKLVKGK